MEYQSYGIADTESIAAEFASQLKAGDVVFLTGDLGAGKTAFVRGLAAGLGLSNTVQSPTFTIVNEYRGGELPLFHFDLYRLEDEDALYDIGFEEYMVSQGIFVMEWPEIARGMVGSHWEIHIERELSISEDYRRIAIEYKE